MNDLGATPDLIGEASKDNAVIRSCESPLQFGSIQALIES
jgi:hypothetical protein